MSSRIASQATTGRPSRPTRADARIQEASLRPRQHGGGSTAPRRRTVTTAGNPSADLKRRRANVLFVLVLTAVCGGFLAATTDSKAMVYLFALAMLSLGGYVYLLVTLNQRDTAARGYDDDRYAVEPGRRAAEPVERVPPRRPSARRDHGEFDDDRFDEYVDDHRAVRQPAPRPQPPVSPPARRLDYGEMPGSGVSGRISYGRLPAARQPALRDPYGRDGVGWESAGREATRRAPARNGRHATGQHQAVRGSQRPAARGYYSAAG